MMIVKKSLALQETVLQMGFASVEDFAIEKAREKLLIEIVIGTDKIEEFEKKYGFDYTNFCLKFQELPQALFEKEEDSAEWNAELKQLNILQKRLSCLS